MPSETASTLKLGSHSSEVGSLAAAQGGGEFLLKRAEQIGYEAQADLDQVVNPGTQSISKES